MTSTRVNEIDLLRFLAAMAVVLFHYSFRGYAADGMSVMPYPALAPYSKYGYLGVELFFIISGFVILMTAASGSLRRFVISRLVRLYPAFWACCTITFLMIVAVGGSRYSASVSQYLVNMTMLSGFVKVPAIDGVYWSVFVEMRFYALVALLLVIGRIHQAQLFLIFWLIASLALELFPFGKLRYLLLVDYSAFFIAGATYFLIWSKGISATKMGMVVLSWALAVFQSINSLPSFEYHYHTSMSRFVVAGIITLFFLIMILVSLRITAFFGRRRWLLAGALTYPLYLLHQNIGFMIFNAAYSEINPHLLLWGTTIFVMGAAYGVNILVERRFAIPMKNAINNFVAIIQRKTSRSAGKVR